MKYAVLVVTCAFLGSLTGLLSAWGAAVYSSPIVNPDPRPGWFMSMPAWGAVGGTVVGLIAFAVSQSAARSAALQESNPALRRTAGA